MVMRAGRPLEKDRQFGDSPVGDADLRNPVPCIVQLSVVQLIQKEAYRGTNMAGDRPGGTLVHANAT